MIGLISIVLYPTVLIYAENIRTGKNHQLLTQVKYTVLRYNLSYIILYKPIDY